MTSRRRNFISIGELSKITGVNIRCLRYYDRIGVLKPAHINPDSGYRYYSVTQVYIVEIIRLCVELDIPLRDLAEYVDEEQGIDFAALLDFGQRAAKAKLAEVERGLTFLTALRQEMEHLEDCKKVTGRYSRTFAERLFLVLPYEKGQQDKEFPRSLHELFALSAKEQTIPLYDYGLCHAYGPGGVEKYIYLEVLAEGAHSGRTLRIPAGNYACMQVEGCCLKDAASLFPGMLDTGGPAFAIETELLTRNCRLEQPRMELQIWKAERAVNE